MGTQTLAGSRGIKAERHFVVVEDTCMKAEVIPVVWDDDSTQTVERIAQKGLTYSHHLMADY